MHRSDTRRVAVVECLLCHMSSFLFCTNPLFMAYNELRIVNGEHRCTTATLLLSFRVHFQHKRSVAMPYSIVYVRVVCYFHQHPRFEHPKYRRLNDRVIVFNANAALCVTSVFTYRVFSQTIALHRTKC